MSVTGTPRSFSLEGISFDVAGDANISLVPIYENSKIPTSGKAMSKKVKRVPRAESLVLIMTWAEYIVVERLNESNEDLKFSIEFADGTFAKTEGTFDIESFESEEGRLTISIDPSLKWTFYPA